MAERQQRSGFPVGKVIVGVGIVSIVLWAATASKAATKIIALKKEIRGVKVLPGSNIWNTKLEIVLALINDRVSNIRFNSFIGDILYKNSVLTSFYAVKDILIGGLDTTIIKIPVTVSNLQLLKVIGDLLFEKETDITVVIKGVIKADGVSLPVNEKVTILKSKRPKDEDIFWE